MGTSGEGKLLARFYRRDVLAVARELLGATLCRRIDGGSVLRGTIVEVEAYVGEHDLASHARMGPTARNRPMYEAGGVAYVYLVYGMHHCLNVVTGGAGDPQAILLRATTSPDGTSASGPGRLCRAFRVDRTLDGASLLEDALWIERGPTVADRDVRRTPRIGVDYAGGWARRRLRFVVAGHPDVSGPKAVNGAGSRTRG
ncbi:MAG TPA: DNA-3-methyladenine glycosylase [Candidatus Polarisedimenticolaceae bacterium]